MGLREKLVQNKPLAVTLVAGIFVAAGVSMVYQFRNGMPARPEVPRVYFTVDDGRSYFADSADQIAPFTKDGKQAVRAHVYSCNGKPFVAFLERYTTSALETMNQATEMSNSGRGAEIDRPKVENAARNGLEVKHAGADKWLMRNTAAGQDIAVKIICPDKSTPEYVSPE